MDRKRRRKKRKRIQRLKRWVILGGFRISQIFDIFDPEVQGGPPAPQAAGWGSLEEVETVKISGKMRGDEEISIIEDDDETPVNNGREPQGQKNPTWKSQR